MTTDADGILAELEQATDQVIALIVNNNTKELEKSVIKQVQLMKKLATISQDALSENRLRALKHKVEQQQVLVNQALEVTNLYLTALHELSNFSHLG